MVASISRPLVLNDGVVIVPVGELPDESRARIDCNPGDFAISRLNSRNGSKIVDGDAAQLLSRFREQRSVVEAVILFAREKRLEPEKVLENAYPFLRNMIEGGFLVPTGQEPTGTSGVAPSGTIEVGSRIAGGSVLRTLQVLEDTEVFLLAREDGSYSALKIERLSSPSETNSQSVMRQRLSHEAAFLKHLGGSIAPKLLEQGEVGNRLYLEMEFVPGVDVATAAAEWRDRGDVEGRRVLLSMVQRMARAYAALHEQGVLHGDVHPSNVLMTGDGHVRLIDFGVAQGTTVESSLPASPDRGGIPFFFEPELARASLSGQRSFPATAAGEQHAVAALIYLLITGDHWQNFRLGREAMLQDIAELKPLSFRERGSADWPELENVLKRALEKLPEDRFPSMQAFGDALAMVTLKSPEQATLRIAPAGWVLEGALANVAPDGAWSKALLSPAPTTSLNYGSAGVALGLLHIALKRSDATLLSWADLWSRRAINETGNEAAFFNPKIEITQEIVGHSSPYHSASGVHAVAALMAAASADPFGQGQALDGFLQAIEQPAAGLDLTLGKSSILLGASILLDALPKSSPANTSALRSAGDRILSELWETLDAKPEIKNAGIEYLGIAHGWAGFLYATLQWCKISRSPVPQGVERRLVELGALAIPTGRGQDWPWMLGRSDETSSMPGWCNGACGYVFLWTLAHQMFGQSRYLDLAHGAAWRSWEASEEIVTLCCGLAGRAYALLNLHRHTGEKVWLHRARDLAVRGGRMASAPTEYPHSLYKGEWGLAVLMADLEAPDESAMPFFEPYGYQS
jgi:serine/threonine-protein kinase